MENIKYNNYHKHTRYSAAIVPDTHIDVESYFKRAIELGHDTYFTTEHGFGGSIFEAKKMSNKYNIKSVFAMEIYVTDSIDSKKTYHMMIIARTDDARKKINFYNSKANEENYRNRRGRWIPEYFSNFSQDEIYVTNACVAGVLRDVEAIRNVFLPIYKYVGKSFYIEIQNHNEKVQKDANKLALDFAKKFDLKIVHANDSHYIYPEQGKDRLGYLKGKGINYGDEDSFILDYPDSNDIIRRYRKQGVVPDEVVIEALNNTLDFTPEEDTIKIDKSIKMPTIYPDLNIDEKHDLLKNTIATKFKKIKDEDKIKKESLPLYIKGIGQEFKTIKDTAEVRSVDYFLLNERIVDLGVNKYKGVITKNGRGSNTSFYINRLLGFTEIDRFRSKLPLYPERFMSISRLLETKSMPDNDLNTSNPEPFVKASKEVMGDDGCYVMIAYGTMQEGEAFRNTCRDKNLDYDIFNEVAKNLDEYRQDEKWGKVLEESKKYIDSIVSVSPHPCAYLIMDKNIREEIGLIRIKDELVAVITSDEADEWKYLKNDFLTVTVWDIIEKVYKEINKPIDSLLHLLENLDERVWKLYEDGITATLNQVDSEWAKNMVKKYKPRTPEELAMFTACIRPSFESFRDDFLLRVDYTHGVEQLDNLFKPTDKWILFQENLMQFLSWLGIKPDETIGIIKKISKKKFTQNEFDDLEGGLRKEWIKNVGDDSKFDETWKKIQSMIAYGYNTPHAISVANDSLYGAYLKVNYPFEYYKVVLDIYSGNTERTMYIVDELKYFDIKLSNIKFGKSKAKHSFDKSERKIYKGMYSIKYINEKISQELYDLRHNKYNSFVELLIDIKTKTSTDARQLMILTKLDFFSEFGKSKKLLQVIEIYDNIHDRIQFKKDELSTLGIPEYLMKKFSNKETPKLYKEVDTFELVNYLSNQIEDKEISIKERYEHEKEYLGYLEHTYNDSSEELYYVTNFKTYGDKKSTPYLSLYQISTGKTIRAQITKAKVFSKSPFKEGAILQIYDMRQELKKKKVSCELHENKYGKMVDYKYIQLEGEYKNVIENYEAY